MNISATLTRNARSARLSKSFLSSTRKRPQTNAVGLGTASVSSAGAWRVETMERRRKRHVTPASRSGASKTPAQLRISTSEGTFRENTAFQPLKSNGCVRRKEADAPFASELRLGFSLTIATPKAMCGRFFVRPAIHFLAGTRRRPARSSSSRVTLPRTRVDAPCHADVLLELANR